MIAHPIRNPGLAIGAVLILASCGDDTSIRLGDPAQDAGSPPPDSSMGMSGPPMGSAPSQQAPPAAAPDHPTAAGTTGTDPTPATPTTGTDATQPERMGPSNADHAQNHRVDPPDSKATLESESDHRISDSIRQVLAGRNDLSSSAKNVAITTRDGIVTLRGQVADAHERDVIATLASNQGGVVRVDNQIEGPNP